jgi:hypothetical protein
MDVKEDTTSPVLVSVFSNRIVVPVFYGVITSILLPATVWYALTSNDVFDIIGGIIAFLVIALIWLVIVGGELRLKTHRIYFKANNYNTISECTIGLQPAYPFPYECITLISNQKEILRISQFYFRNYLEMKLLVIDTFKEYKIIKFSLKKYILEIFKS